MTPQETIAHLQSQLDECRKELAEARSRAFNHEESYRRLIENTDAEALSYRSEITRLKELKHAAETALAALQVRVEAGERDNASLKELITHQEAVRHAALEEIAFDAQPQEGKYVTGTIQRAHRILATNTVDGILDCVALNTSAAAASGQRGDA
jgi:predicted  nucleic acid-binding Zn-ribbon protein